MVTIAGSPSVEEIGAKFGPPSLFLQFFLWLKKNSKAQNAAAANNVDWSYMFLNPNGKDLETLAGYVDAGQVKPVIDMIQTLDDFKIAVDRLASGRSKGKCVIKI